MASSDILQSQLQSLDDTDVYASAWSDAVTAANQSETAVSWGGRGKGGRALARRTVQPHTIVVDDVRLEYVNDLNPSLPRKLLLDGATLKLLPNKVYALAGYNGCGKSTLLKRIAAGKIPGFPTHVSSMYISQEVLPECSKTPLEIVLGQHKTYFQRSTDAIKERIEQLEVELESVPADQNEEMEKLCEEISTLEDQLTLGHDTQAVCRQAQDSLLFFGVDELMWNKPSGDLSGGIRKKISLAAALFCHSDLLLLDEPTNMLDVRGLIQLRRLIESHVNSCTTVLIVSHDVDLINDVATDVIHFHNNALSYYVGNYRDFIRFSSQKELHRIRQGVALKKKRDHMMQTIDNLKKQPVPKRGGAKKKGKQIESVKKKLEKQGLEKDSKGHRWTAQTAGSGVREGSINSVGAGNRSKMSHSELLRLKETHISPVPDKAVQFIFRDTKCSWNEPLITAMDVGFGYDVKDDASTSGKSEGGIHANEEAVVAKDGYLFDCVDMCINEGTTSCILGANCSGKSTLLKLLAKREHTLEGTIQYAHNVGVAYFDQHEVDTLIERHLDDTGAVTPLSLLAQRYPKKTEQDLRGELTSFGLNPKQAQTNIRFLSGGERSRLCLANLLLSDPDVLLMDEPTSHLDVASVEALAYGLKNWNGTIVLVTHDANLIRSVEGHCYVLLEEEGKLRTIPNGIDDYLASFEM